MSQANHSAPHDAQSLTKLYFTAWRDYHASQKEIWKANMTSLLHYALHIKRKAFLSLKRATLQKSKFRSASLMIQAKENIVLKGKVFKAFKATFKRRDIQQAFASKILLANVKNLYQNSFKALKEHVVYNKSHLRALNSLNIMRRAFRSLAINKEETRKKQESYKRANKQVTLNYYRRVTRSLRDHKEAQKAKRIEDEAQARVLKERDLKKTVFSKPAVGHIEAINRSQEKVKSPEKDVLDWLERRNKQKEEKRPKQMPQSAVNKALNEEPSSRAPSSYYPVEKVEVIPEKRLGMDRDKQREYEEKAKDEEEVYMNEEEEVTQEMLHEGLKALERQLNDIKRNKERLGKLKERGMEEDLREIKSLSGVLDVQKKEARELLEDVKRMKSVLGLL